MSKKRLEGLDLNLLLALHWLLTERNVTAAANQLGMSQPSASRALARLRHVFDDPLLVKSGASMTPTPVAEKLQPAVAQAINQCRDILKMPERFDPARERSRFRIACVDYIGAMTAKAWLTHVRDKAPGIDLDFISPTMATAQDLVSGKTDMVLLPDSAIADLPASVNIDEFIRKPIMDISLKTAMRKGHPLAGEKMTLKRYCESDHILVTDEILKAGVVDRALAEQNLTRRVAFKTSTFLLALSILQHSDCIITGPGGLLQLDIENLEITEPPISLPGFKLLAGWHPNWDEDERHTWIRKQLYHACVQECGAGIGVEIAAA